ncbi:hypothetical protein HGG75_09470 [Ochrobactrum pseudogrignonense]|nr:hypothetical protein [Brucella pseudogrignonensis]
MPYILLYRDNAMIMPSGTLYEQSRITHPMLSSQFAVVTGHHKRDLPLMWQNRPSSQSNTSFAGPAAALGRLSAPYIILSKQKCRAHLRPALRLWISVLQVMHYQNACEVDHIIA